MSAKVLTNKISCLLIAVLMMLSITVVNMPEVKAASTIGFYVDGTTIRDANGNAFVMRGVNQAYCWYPNETETAIKAIASKGANTIRLVLGDGEKYTYTSASTVEWLIKLCIENKVIPILEIHDATGSDNTSSLNNAVNYWIGIKSVLQQYEKYVIVNIANEWMGSWNGSDWASGYQSAIPTLRNAGINNMLMVDAPGWGQNGDNCVNYCQTVFNSDTQKNTVFSIHMYGTAGKNSTVIKSQIDGVLGKGVPLVIGEFGNYHSDGDVDEAYIMQYCTEKNVGYLGWSWKGNSDGVEYLDIANDWPGNSLSDWGKTLFNSTNGIVNTSKSCSIFTTSSDSSSSSSQVTPPTYEDAVNLWNGSIDMGNWTGYQKISSSSLSNVKVGDTIRVSVANVQTGAQVEIQNTDWKSIDGWGVQDVNENSYVDYVISESNINVVKNGIIVKGQKATLTSIDVITSETDDSSEEDSSSMADESSSLPDESSSTPDESSSTADSEVTETIWTGNVTTNGWSGGEDRTLDFGDSLNEFKSISKIEFVLESGSQFQLNWGSSPFDQYVDISTPCKYTVTDATQIQYIIDNNGISVNGKDIKLTEVKVTGVKSGVMYTVIYKNNFDFVLKQYTTTSSTEIKAQACDANTSMQGYVLVSWTWTNGESSGTVKDPSELVLLPGTTVFTGVYEYSSETYNVTVIGGDLYVKSDENDTEYTKKIDTALNYIIPNFGKIKLVAEDVNPEGERFAYWTLNNMIYSYDREIYFSAWADSDFCAVYEQDIEAEPIVFIDNNAKIYGFESNDNSTHKITYSVAYYLPNGYTVAEKGIVYSGKTGLTNLEALSSEKQLISGNVKAPTSCAILASDDSAAYNQFRVSIYGTPSGYDRNAKAFITYYDTYGNKYVIYSENTVTLTNLG